MKRRWLFILAGLAISYVLLAYVLLPQLWTHHEHEPGLASLPMVTRTACAYRKLNPGILVMQSAQDWATKNVPGAIDGARDRCIFLQG